MKMENTLANHISAASDKASYDASCKRLLANKMILAWIMQSCLDEYKDYDVKEIAEKYIEGSPEIAQVAVNPDEVTGSEQIKGMQTEDSTINEGTITYDIRYFAVVPQTKEPIGLIINIEAQNDFYPGYPLIKRGIYYCGRMISSQYGTEFHAGHYADIKKVYSIWVCMSPPENRKNTINRYSVMEENLVGAVKEPVEHYDLLSVVMICLGDSDEENHSSGILKLLEVLLSSEREAADKKRILQEEFKIEMTKDLESEVSLMCNLSKGVEEKGILKGRQEGLLEGRQEELLNSIRNIMDTLKLTLNQAMDALKVPEADRKKYEKEINKK